jgi:hypothetical protein
MCTLCIRILTLRYTFFETDNTGTGLEITDVGGSVIDDITNENDLDINTGIEKNSNDINSEIVRPTDNTDGTTDESISVSYDTDVDTQFDDMQNKAQVHNELSNGKHAVSYP